MRDMPVKGRLRWLRWVAAILLLLLAVVLTAPFLLTAQLVHLALWQVLPANSPRLGSATLSPSSTLVLRDLVLHDTGALAQQPLVMIREVEAAFHWAELFSRRIRRVQVEDVTLYARTNGPSQLSLLDLLFERFPSGPLEEPNQGTLPLWIDTLTVHGMLHLEPVRGFVPASTDWPLALQLTTSGERVNPSRQFRMALGDTRQLPEQIPEKPSATVTERAPSHDGVFALRAEVEMQPTVGGKRGLVYRLAARQAAFTIESNILRQYMVKLPAELEGPIETSLGSLWASGESELSPDLHGPGDPPLATPHVSSPQGAGTGHVLGLRGNIQLQDLSVRSPAGGQASFALDRLMLAGSVEARLDRWEPAALKVRDGVTRWATLRYRNHALDTLDASWRIDGRKLVIDRLAAQIFGGHISGSLAWDLITHAIPHCEFQITGINMHAALANISPEHLDAEGHASGLLRLVLSEAGELSGNVDLTFDGPGLLKIGEIEEVKRMLVGNVGLSLAMLALDDLKQYPFKEGRLYLESSGQNSQLKVTFVRQPRSQADVTPPHKEIIDGQEVWVGSLVVPTIDLTVPITGKSLAEILSIAGGIRPLDEAPNEQHGK